MNGMKGMRNAMLVSIGVFLTGIASQGTEPTANKNEDVNTVFDRVDATVDAQVTSILEKLLSKHKEIAEVKISIEALADRRTVEKNGVKQKASMLATTKLKALGEAALPDLIRATEHAKPDVRARSLGIVFDISRKSKISTDLLPVYVRSLRDRSKTVRKSAASQIGNLCVMLAYRKREAELQKAMKFLLEALNDDSQEVQYVAGEYLVRLGRKELVPRRLIDEKGLGEENVGG